MRYVTNDGKVLDGETFIQIVKALNRVGISPYENLNKFMRDVAKRVKLQSGGKIRTNTSRNFIKDLTAMGFLREEG